MAKDKMPAEAVERFARALARVLLDRDPAAERVAVFRAEDVGPGREIAVAVRGTGRAEVS